MEKPSQSREHHDLNWENYFSSSPPLQLLCSIRLSRTKQFSLFLVPFQIVLIKKFSQIYGFSLVHPCVQGCRVRLKLHVSISYSVGQLQIGVRGHAAAGTTLALLLFLKKKFLIIEFLIFIFIIFYRTFLVNT